MSGKLCVGSTLKQGNTYLINESKAFCEGVAHRTAGDALEKPVTDNPHVAGSSASIAWIDGWDIADGKAGSAVDPSQAPCCAIPETVVPA